MKREGEGSAYLKGQHEDDEGGKIEHDGGDNLMVYGEKCHEKVFEGVKVTRVRGFVTTPACLAFTFSRVPSHCYGECQERCQKKHAGIP